MKGSEMATNMEFDYRLDNYKEWLAKNVILTDPFSEIALRKLTFDTLMGGNYRLLTEYNTKGKLLATYLWLSEIQKDAIEKYGPDWMEFLLQDLNTKTSTPKELKNLLLWIMGLAAKTATNLGFKKEHYPEILKETIEFFHELFSDIGREDFKDQAWLLLMAGSATLNIRGSQKSKIGKQFEGVLTRAILTLLGFTENVNCWMNIDRDAEVDREADAEVESKRGRIRIELGLIASGNQEVIEDKIGRVGRHGVVIFDKLGQSSRVYQTAENQGVKLVQIRNNNPLLEIYRYLNPLTNVELNEPPEEASKIQENVDSLPAEIFIIEE